ncbi:MAG TPA: SLC13 family permease [Spirochaetota bacterium]|nr:SLC13 family permease [Spirochaetota bacterium]HPJ34023.1 SLC13 family permease [Spirochaetota bacterium]
MAEFEGKNRETSARAIAIFCAAHISLGFLLFNILGNIQQTAAATIFISLVTGTLLFWRFRVAIAFIGIVILMITGTIDLEHTVKFMSLDVILFLIGMMVIVGLLRRSGFFRWLLAKGLEISRFRPHLLLVIIILLSATMAALVDEVTSILFTTALVLDFSDFFEVKAVRLTMVVVIATNIGSSWTVLGNPIGILIALRSGLTFGDFLMNSLPVGLLSLAAIIILALWWMKRDLRYFRMRIEKTSGEEKENFIRTLKTVKDKKCFAGSTAIFLFVIISLAMHNRLEIALGLQHNTLLVGSSLLGAGITMLWQREMARSLIMKEVDWWTLVFFMFLFAKAGALEYTGITDLIGEQLYSLTGGGGAALLIILILWLTAFSSAAADNVVVVATFIPVIQYLTAHTGNEQLWWALLFGGCYGGNMTMVGSTANIIALGILEEKKEYIMTLRYWIKLGLAGALIPMVIGTMALLLLLLF